MSQMLFTMCALTAALAGCRYDEHVWECTSCGHLLLTAHQLDLHVQEVHDSFFQAQAARSMKVKSLRVPLWRVTLREYLNTIPTKCAMLIVLQTINLRGHPF